MSDLWPHQADGIDAAYLSLKEGYRRILVTTPTGGGKTRQMSELARLFLQEGEPVLLYANRKLLIEQLSRVLTEAGLTHGVRAAGHVGDAGELFQVASIQTEHSRTIKRQEQSRYEAKLILVDEAHCQTGAMFSKLIDQHIEEDGASVVGYTATPIELGAYYDKLIVAGTMSELRACGATVLATHYGCDEPDLKKLKAPQGADISENEQVKAIMRPGIFGRVWSNFQALNPDHRPTILFAPGVKESLWFAEQFVAKGVPAAHIDGETIWINGEYREATPETRARVLADSKSGRVCVLCNRFVLREGIDAPWLGHCILACIYGSLQSYLQSGGRLLRAYPGLEAVTVQDHGGNWWRHGSLNADREWFLDWTAGMHVGVRAERLRKGCCRKCGQKLGGPMCAHCHTLNDYEPTCCPQCHRVIQGRFCSCGWKSMGEKRSRPVVSVEGVLKEHLGDIFTPRRITKAANGLQVWERMYWRARTEKWDATFTQAEAVFALEGDFGYPDRSWPLMPRDEVDLFRKVKDVPFDRLIPREGGFVPPTSKCRSCSKPIIWCVTEGGKRAPIDTTVSLQGNVIICGDQCRVVDRVKEPEFKDIPLHTNHFATCAQASLWKGAPA